MAGVDADAWPVSVQMHGRRWCRGMAGVGAHAWLALVQMHGQRRCTCMARVDAHVWLALVHNQGVGAHALGCAKFGPHTEPIWPPIF